MRFHLWRSALATGLAALAPCGRRHAGPHGIHGRGFLV
jgi:hypothetical protein